MASNSTRGPQHRAELRSERHRDDARTHERHEHSHGHHPSSPFALMHQGLDEMDRWFHRLTGGDTRSAGSSSWTSPSSWMPSPSSWMPAAGSWMPSAQRMGDWMPAIEAFQRGNEFVIRADVPGMTRTDLHVDAGDDSITIRGERKQEHSEDREGLYWSERSYGSFCRTIPLPPGAISESAKASFSNGVLEIVVSAPSPEARRGRRIDISGSPDATKG